MKKVFCLILTMMLMLLSLSVFAEREQKVFFENETTPFPADAELLTLRVAAMGGGDCMLLTLGDHSMFVDLGTESSFEKVEELIQVAGIDHVDYFYNSHPHVDHVGGFMPLVESGFPVGAMITFFDHDIVDYSVKQWRATRTAEANNIPIIDMKTEDQIPFGDAELTVYRVPDDRIVSAMLYNDLSAMLHIRYGDCTILLTGDVEPRAQLTTAEVYGDRMKADIMKHPHHGVDVIKIPFFEAVDPEFIFFTGSAYNTQKPQEALKRLNVTRMTFAPWGIITMQTDGHKWIVSQDLYPDKANQARFYLKDYNWIEVPFQLP